MAMISIPLQRVSSHPLTAGFRITGSLLAALALSLAVPAMGSDPAAPSAAPLPQTDNAAPPYKGVYRWGQGGCIKGLYDGYGQWLNRNVIWPVDFMPTETWDGLEGQDWQLGTWGPWIHKQAGRRLVLSLPVLPGGWSCKGPIKGIDAHAAVSLEEGAKGTYNIHFQHLAEHLVQRGLGDTLIRVGWEFNGGWYTWRAQTADKAQAFAAYFHQIVTTMRAVPGAQNLKFIWNPAMEPWWPYPTETAWPGDDVVDYVGIDVYDQSWMKDTYPFPANATDQEILARQQKAWDEKTNSEQAKGLPYWVSFAQKHGKPLVIPEWGICIRKDTHGGGDDPLFIDGMYRFITNPDNHVYFESYFDVSAGDGDHRLIAEPDSKNPGTSKETLLPKSEAKFKAYFTLPDSAKAKLEPAPDAAPPAASASASTAPAAATP